MGGFNQDNHLCEIGEASIILDLYSALTSKGKRILVKSCSISQTDVIVERKGLQHVKTNVQTVLNNMNQFVAQLMPPSSPDQIRRKYVFKRFDIEAVKIKTRGPVGYVSMKLPTM